MGVGAGGGGGTWRVALFGGPRLERGQTVVTRFKTQKIAALLAYLALHLHRAHPREELADRFWPDSDVDAARGNLRSALAALRRLFEDDPDTPAGSVLLGDWRQTVGLNPEAVTVDVLLFERAVNAAGAPDTPDAERTRLLTEAADLYRGPLLPGISEPWASAERDRFAEAHLRALHELTRLHEASGNLDAALEYGRRAIAADPLREEAHADVIRLLTASGQPGGARRQFDALTKLLRERSGAEPSEATRALLSASPVGPLSPSFEANSFAVASAPTPGPSPAAGEGRAEGRAVAAPAAVPRSVFPLPSPAAGEGPGVGAGAGAIRLPPALSRFFGREDEMAALAELLSAPGTRLVTLTGPGGGGKTRLAVETARALARRFPGGVAFVPLADVREASRIGESVADALGLPRTPSAEPALSRVAAALRAAGGPALLLLDNFEQIAEEGAGVVYELLQAAPNLTCLVTSRQRLLLDGEREFPVLPLPTPEHAGSPERLAEFPSVQLFVNRAQAARPDFALTARNAAAVAKLCAKLEGVPLAIEIAASWCQTLAPAQMLDRLSRRFDLLVTRRRDVSTRHATLRATIQWSYDLLPPEARRLLAALSVFRGGWTLEAAEAVCEGADAFLHLTTLREHSLVIAEDPDGEAGPAPIRFRMLESLREFAEETLSDEERALLAPRHAAHFAAVAEAAAARLAGAEQSAAVAELVPEQPNLRAALDWALSDDGDPTLALRIGASLWRFWMLRGEFSEGRRLLDAVLGRAPTDADPVLLAHVLNGAGSLARLQGDNARARPLLEEAVALLRALPADGLHAQRALAMCLQNLAIVRNDGGEYDATVPLYEESLAIRRRIGDRDGVANVLNSLGIIAFEQGDPAAARALYEEALAIRNELGYAPRAAPLLNLGGVALALGDAGAARGYLEEGVRIAREAGQRQVLATGLASLGTVLLDGDEGAAWAVFLESLRLFVEIGDVGSLAAALECAAPLALHTGQAAVAARLLGAAEAYRERVAIPIPPNERPAYERSVAAARAALGDAAFASAWAAGRTFVPEQAVAEAEAAAQRPGTV